MSKSVPPTPPQLGFPGIPKPAARTIDYLARPIANVCESRQGVLPMNCFSLAKAGGKPPSGEDLLKGRNTGADGPPVDDIMCERLLSALASIINADNAAVRTITDRTSIRDFRMMSQPAQLAFINRIWDANCSAHAFNQAGSQMFDPPGDGIDGNAPLPTSIRPVRIGMNVFEKRLKGRQPFREFGVGFRVDGSDASSVGRVTGNGMTQQRLSPAFMLSRRGLRLDATAMMDPTVPRVWTGNHDIFNETAVCVSRNFFGASAFPERDTNGRSYLWAVNCGPLLGFDTENYQLGLHGAKQWRPGEKAFQFIPAANVLGYVQIDRRGAPSGGGWMVDFPKDASWVYTGAPSVKQRMYMEDELAAWRGGSYTIPAAFDFANE